MRLLLEPHTANDCLLMALYVPHWQHLRRQLNRLPVRRENRDG